MIFYYRLYIMAIASLRFTRPRKSSLRRMGDDGRRREIGGMSGEDGRLGGCREKTGDWGDGRRRREKMCMSCRHELQATPMLGLMAADNRSEHFDKCVSDVAIWGVAATHSNIQPRRLAWRRSWGSRDRWLWKVQGKHPMLEGLQSCSAEDWKIYITTSG